MSKSELVMQDANLEGQLLIAMPGMSDERFARSVVYMCAHSDEGAMGLIINKPTEKLRFGDLLEQINLLDNDETIELSETVANRPVHTGGPVEADRGFVLHSPDYFAEAATMAITDGICLTATTDILKAMAAGSGPQQAMLALGYSGWAPGQLESELGANGWLNCPADPALVFAQDPAEKYERALSKLGVASSQLVTTAGRA